MSACEDACPLAGASAPTSLKIQLHTAVRPGTFRGPASRDVLSQPRKPRSQLLGMVAPHSLEETRLAPFRSLQHTVGSARAASDASCMSSNSNAKKCASVQIIEYRPARRMSCRHPAPAARKVVEYPKGGGILTRVAPSTRSVLAA